MSKISTIVITYNEERNVERCLKSVVPFSDEIVVVDSHSSDRTVEIAQRHATRVLSHDWLGFGKQKQLALDHATHPWIFSIDGDEEVSSKLCAEIQGLDFNCDGYEMPRKPWYLNRWITHSGWYPGYILRLFRKDKGAFTDEIVHERVVVNGTVGRLKSDLLHYSYRDIAHHIDKMNNLTTLSARQMLGEKRKAGIHTITLLPVFEFMKTYIGKRGALDGFAGLTISVLHAYYVFLKYAKLREMWSSPASVTAATQASAIATQEGAAANKKAVRP